MSEKWKRPWRVLFTPVNDVSFASIVDADGVEVAFSEKELTEDEADETPLHLAVSCVNALDGLDSKAVSELVEWAIRTTDIPDSPNIVARRLLRDIVSRLRTPKGGR